MSLGHSPVVVCVGIAPRRDSSAAVARLGVRVLRFLKRMRALCLRGVLEMQPPPSCRNKLTKASESLAEASLATS